MKACIYSALAAVFWYAGASFGSPALLTAGCGSAVLGVVLFALSRWGCTRIDVSAEPVARDVPRGSEAGFLLSVRNRSRIPVGEAEVRLRCSYQDDLTDPLTLAVEATCRGRSGVQATVKVQAPHCGVLRLEVEEVRVCDPTGIFTATKRPSTRTGVVVVPPAAHPDASAFAALPHARTDERPDACDRAGAVPPDVLDLRSYRAGDPLHSVHWKLSARSGALVTRVHAGEAPTGTVLAVEIPRGDAELRDAVLEAAANEVAGLVRAGVPCTLAWTDGDRLQRGFAGAAADVPPLLRELAQARGGDPGPATAFAGAATAPVLTLGADLELRLGAATVARFDQDGLPKKQGEEEAARER